MTERIYEVNWEDKPVILRERTDLKIKTFPHRVSLVIPRTMDNKFIVSRRSKSKFPFPDVWVCAIGGKVSHDEDYSEAKLHTANLAFFSSSYCTCSSVQSRLIFPPSTSDTFYLWFQ